MRTLPRGATSTPTTRPPGLVYVIAAGIFLMGATEFMIAGLLPEAAADLGLDVAQTVDAKTGYASPPPVR